MANKRGIQKGSRVGQILELARAGESATTIAKMIGCTPSNVHQACRRYGVAVINTHKRIASHRDKITNLRANGLTCARIADIVGFDDDTVRRFLRRTGAIKARPFERRFWNEDEIKVLQDLWPRRSATQIGEQLGRTRDQVIAKARRLGIAKDGGNHVN